jgi:hypothetical protein
MVRCEEEVVEGRRAGVAGEEIEQLGKVLAERVPAGEEDPDKAQADGRRSEIDERHQVRGQTTAALRSVA